MIPKDVQDDGNPNLIFSRRTLLAGGAMSTSALLATSLASAESSSSSSSHLCVVRPRAAQDEGFRSRLEITCGLRSTLVDTGVTPARVRFQGRNIGHCEINLITLTNTGRVFQDPVGPGQGFDYGRPDVVLLVVFCRPEQRAKCDIRYNITVDI
jgi:hypothetical protein